MHRTCKTYLLLHVGEVSMTNLQIMSHGSVCILNSTSWMQMEFYTVPSHKVGDPGSEGPNAAITALRSFLEKFWKFLHFPNRKYLLTWLSSWILTAIRNLSVYEVGNHVLSSSNLKHQNACVGNSQVDFCPLPVLGWMQAYPVHLQPTSNLQKLEVRLCWCLSPWERK